MFWNGWNNVEDNTQEVFMGGMGLWKTLLLSGQQISLDWMGYNRKYL
jgi:hypothetical protein